MQSSNSALHQHAGTSGLNKKCFRCFSSLTILQKKHIQDKESMMEEDQTLT